jgi:hypothetical protein
MSELGLRVHRLVTLATRPAKRRARRVHAVRLGNASVHLHLGHSALLHEQGRLRVSAGREFTSQYVMGYPYVQLDAARALRMLCKIQLLMESGCSDLSPQRRRFHQPEHRVNCTAQDSQKRHPSSDGLSRPRGMHDSPHTWACTLCSP